MCSVFHVHSNFCNALNLLDCLPGIADDRRVIGGGEEDAESDFAVEGGGNVADHSGLEDVESESVVSHARESGIYAYLKII
jgi:hypothetical protein